MLVNIECHFVTLHILHLLNISKVFQNNYITPIIKQAQLCVHLHAHCCCDIYLRIHHVIYTDKHAITISLYIYRIMYTTLYATIYYDVDICIHNWICLINIVEIKVISEWENKGCV